MPSTCFLEKHFLWLVALLLAIMGATQVASITGESQTADEAVHLAAGYSYLKTGDFRINYQHPPLGKYINALPLLLLQPNLPFEDASWADADAYKFGSLFLYKNNHPADTLLFYGRLPTVLLTLCFGLVIALWTRRYFNAPAALLALILFSFDPNIIAHGRYITSDLVVALVMFLACAAWFQFLEQRTWRTLIQSGILLGAALLSKASAVILLPMFAALYLICWWQGRVPGSSLKHLILAMAGCLGLGFFVVYAGYAFETRSVLSEKALARRFAMTPEELHADPHVSNVLRRLIDPTTPIGRISHVAVRYIRIPAYSYLSGVYWQADKNKQGHDSYLLGKYSQFGWWYYFPVAFAVKTPTGVLLLLAFCLILVARKAARKAARESFSSLGRGLRAVPLQWYVLIVPAAIYLAASMTSHINIGIRHILPVYPFLYILLAVCLLSGALLQSKTVKLWGSVFFAALLIAESASAFPYYLPFFNRLAGGSSQGPRYLIDSNVDWGQDLKRLKAYQAQAGHPDLCLSYFGNIDPAYYGISYRPLTSRTNADACDIAISVNDLYSLSGEYAWLRNLTPDARIGYSIYYYGNLNLKRQLAAIENGDGPASRPSHNQ